MDVLPNLLLFAWLAPLASFVAIVFFGPRMGKHGVWAGWLATLAIVAGLVLSLTALGIWSVVAYAASQRTREIGVRMALGARRHQVIGLVARASGAAVLVGILAGLGGAYLASRAATALVFGVEPTEPSVYVAASALIAAVALLASAHPALRATRGSDAAIELTRAGWSNPAGVPRSTLQRVSYRLEDTDLMREYWTVLDRTQNTEPVRVLLLEHVKSVSVRYLGADRDWKDQWPPLGYSGPNMRVTRPLAVEITLELEDWGEIKRLVEIGG